MMIDEEMKKKMDDTVLAMFANATGLKFNDVHMHLRNSMPDANLSVSDTDKSLQRLRKAGKIRFGGQKVGWETVVQPDTFTHQEMSDGALGEPTP